MKSKDAKEMLLALAARQKAGEHHLCPRCGQDTMNPAGVTRNALSRRLDVYICNACGTEEAIEDYTGNAPLPFRKWAYPVSVEKGG